MKGKEKQKSSHWAVQVFVLAVSLSAALSLISSTALTGAGYVVAVSVLLAFIALGIVFDMIGVAVTAADPRPAASAPCATTWWATSAASSAVPPRR